MFCTRYSAPLRSCVAWWRFVLPRPRPRCCGWVLSLFLVRSDCGWCGVAVDGPGVRFTLAALASTMREVTWSLRKNEVSRDARNSPVRRRSPAPLEKSGKNPTQLAIEAAAVMRYSSLRRACWWMRIPRTILCCDESWRGLWCVLISFARRSCSGMVGGFWCRFIRIPFDGGPQRWSLDVCVMHTWYIASLRISQSGFEFVSIMPSNGWGLDGVFGSRWVCVWWWCSVEPDFFN